MAAFNYYLANDNKRGDKLIMLSFCYDGRRLRYSTGETVNDNYWNEEEQRVKKSLTGCMEINNLLDRIEEFVKKIYREGKTYNYTLTNEYFRDKINKEIDPASNAPKTFFDYYYEFIEIQKTTKALGTIKKYKTLLNHLTDFQQRKRYSISFEKIDTRFYEDFTAFFINDLGLVNNSVAKYIKTLKTFLQWATEREYNKNNSFKKFKTRERDADIIYLTEIELFRLYELDLSKNFTLEKVRDVFCFGCFTGLRYSDILRVNKDNVRGGEINFLSEKTTEILNIPLNKFSETILKKHKYSLPIISNQKTNEYLKKLGKYAEIDEPVLITKFRGAEEIQVTKPKYEFLSTHTARRTFVTLSLEKGMRPETVMNITGHKEYNTFKKYIKITSKVKSIEMKRIWDKETSLLAVV